MYGALIVVVVREVKAEQAPLANTWPNEHFEHAPGPVIGSVPRVPRLNLKLTNGTAPTQVPLMTPSSGEEYELFDRSSRVERIVAHE